MLNPQFILDIHQELIIDNFAGGGGASTGIELVKANLQNLITRNLYKSA